ncbi:MAG: M1 family metallopeptidase [Crocinitomicaceae bacterium]
MHKVVLLFTFYFFLLDGFAQNHFPRYNEIDVVHYNFEIEVNDTTDVLQSQATVDVLFKTSVMKFYLDLVKLNDTGKGMIVTSVKENGIAVPFTHAQNRLQITVPETRNGEFRKYTVEYSGVPADGLIISKNKFGDRTFFGDNWPDRGQNWLPLVDHPSDKATVSWMITAPAHYSSIGNGILIESRLLEGNRKMTQWQMSQPISTKVMVCAVAPFSVIESGQVNGIEVSAWVYPQNAQAGFEDYQQAVPIANYFIEKIGDYPFEKLANVQSTTRFGGMENASNIFYAEESVTGTGECEALIAHEIAHQWFGNSATEASWHDIWLSEGFATYFTNLYFEDHVGNGKFLERIENERIKVIQFYKKNPVPVVNPKIVSYLELLNPNSYQKGALILHMLRHQIGDEKFWLGIRKYYDDYKFENATTSDFQKVMEEISGQDLESFFHQWLNEVGQPELVISWKKNGKVKIQQLQKQFTFQFPLEMKITYESSATRSSTIQVNSKKKKANIKGASKVKSIEIDPNKWLLFELVKLEGK